METPILLVRKPVCNKPAIPTISVTYGWVRLGKAGKVCRPSSRETAENIIITQSPDRSRPAPLHFFGGPHQEGLNSGAGNRNGDAENGASGHLENSLDLRLPVLRRAGHDPQVLRHLDLATSVGMTAENVRDSARVLRPIAIFRRSA